MGGWGALTALQTTDRFPNLEGTDKAAPAAETEVEVFTSKHSLCLASAMCRSLPAGRKGPERGRRRDGGSKGW